MLIIRKNAFVYQVYSSMFVLYLSGYFVVSVTTTIQTSEFEKVIMGSQIHCIKRIYFT